MNESAEEPEKKKFIEHLPVEGLPPAVKSRLIHMMSNFLSNIRPLVVDFHSVASEENEERLSRAMLAAGAACEALDAVIPINPEFYLSYQLENDLLGHISDWPAEYVPDLGNPKWFQWFDSMLKFSFENSD